MIKPAGLVGLVLLAVLAFAVFQVERKVQSLRSELEVINHQIVTDREAIHVLKAEWTYLNNPNRLRTMSDKFLKLEQSNASQYIDIEEIPARPILISGASGGIIDVNAVLRSR